MYQDLECNISLSWNIHHFYSSSSQWHSVWQKKKSRVGRREQSIFSSLEEVFHRGLKAPFFISKSSEQHRWVRTLILNRLLPVPFLLASTHADHCNISLVFICLLTLKFYHRRPRNGASGIQKIFDLSGKTIRVRQIQDWSYLHLRFCSCHNIFFFI